ncbi:MAG: serine protease [Planctomycetes bacterium]|nr:serine protease [Planctomycetota bacterium]
MIPTRRRSSSIVLCTLLCLIGAALPAQDEAFRFDEIKHRLQIGADQKRLVQEIRENGIESLNPEQLAELQKVGAGAELLAELRRFLSNSGSDLVAEVIRRATSDDRHQLLCWILRKGRALRLSRAQMRQMRDAKLDLDLQRALAGSYEFSGFRTYKDPMGVLAVQHPVGWRAYEWWTGSGFRVLLSPEQDVARVNEFTTGMQIQVSATSAGARVRRLGIVDFHKRSLPVLIRANRKFELRPLGEPAAAELAGQPAVEQRLSAKMKGQACHELLARTIAGDLEFFIEFVAPEKEYDGLQKTAMAMLASFRPLPDSVEPRRRNNALVSNEVVQRYRDAVVKVISHGMGTGSGFIAREDGLVLTNAHVIRDDKGIEGPVIAKRISVELHVGGVKQQLKAELLDWIHESKPRIDMALLRLPRSSKPYPTIPISTVKSGRVKIGDSIIALGFPGIGKGELFMTQGSVTAIKYDSWDVRGRIHKRLDQITTDATIAPGNSGGPCIDLHTGGVVGLNTFIFGQSLYSYSGVSAIDHALARFPQLRWYPRGRRMTAEQHLELAGMLSTAGNLHAARKELEICLGRADDLTLEQQAETYWQLAMVCRAENDYTESRKNRDECLKRNPLHLQAALDKALSLRFGTKHAEALEMLSRVEQQNADDWSVALTRAKVYESAKKFPDALAELKRAEELSRSAEPSVFIERGRLLARTGKHDEALSAYRRALQVAPHDEEAAIAVAQHYERQKDSSSAAIEYQKLLSLHPDSPSAYAARARFLSKSTDSKDRSQAVDDALSALFLEWASGSSGGDHLDLAAGLCAKEKSLASVATTLAQLLHRAGGYRKYTAHRILADSWKTRGISLLERVHRGALLFGTKLTVSEAAVEVMIRAGYSPDLLEDTLRFHSLDFAVDGSTVARLEKVPGFQKQHLRPILNRSMRDQLGSTTALGGAVKVEFNGKVNAQGIVPHAKLVFTNLAHVPLGEVEVRRTYYGTNNKVLWSTNTSMASTLGVLEVGKKREVTFYFDSWKSLDAKKLRTQIKSWGVRVVKARNSAYLDAIRVVGRIEQGVYKVHLVNNSLFRLREVELGCSYVTTDTPQRTIYGRGFRPFNPRTMIRDLNLDRGKTSGVYRVPSWPVTLDVLRKNGAVVPAGKNVRPVPKIEDVKLQLY